MLYKDWQQCIFLAQPFLGRRASRYAAFCSNFCTCKIIYLVLSGLLMGSCVLCVLDKLAGQTTGGWTGTDWSRLTVNHVVNTQSSCSPANFFG